MFLSSGIFARFTIMSAHLTILIMLLFERGPNVSSCAYPSEQYSITDTRLIVGLVISVALLVIELAIFLIGPSLFRSQVTFITTLLHSAGAISLSFMIFTRWCSLYYWPVFCICSCIPFFIELTSAIEHNLKN